MKLWLDDERPAPPDWIWVKSAPEAIRYVRDMKEFLTHISLDHDLSPYEGNGLQVAEYIAEERDSLRDEIEVNVHTANKDKGFEMVNVMRGKGIELSKIRYLEMYEQFGNPGAVEVSA